MIVLIIAVLFNCTVLAWVVFLVCMAHLVVAVITVVSFDLAQRFICSMMFIIAKALLNC